MVTETLEPPTTLRRPVKTETELLFQRIGSADAVTPADIEQLHHAAGVARVSGGEAGWLAFWRSFIAFEQANFNRGFDATLKRYDLDPVKIGLDKQRLNSETTITDAEATAESKRRATAGFVEACRQSDLQVRQAILNLDRAKAQLSELETRVGFLEQALASIDPELPVIWLEDCPSPIHWSKRLAEVYSLKAGLKLALADVPNQAKGFKASATACEKSLAAARLDMEAKIAALKEVES